MKRVALTLATFFAASSVALAAPGSVTTLPDQYVQVQKQLTATCGAERASVMANLAWDADIHKQWADVVKADPSQAKYVGDVAWHKHWVKIYQQAIALLSSDC